MNFKIQIPENALKAEISENSLRNNSNIMEWHEKLVHQNFLQIRRIMKNHGIQLEKNDPFCKACAKGKSHRKSFPRSETKTKKVGELIHADLCGPMETNSLGKARYFLLFKDDYSNYRKIYFLKTKDEVKTHFKNFIKRVSMETGRRINTLRTDNGLEFINEETKKILNEEGIEHQNLYRIHARAEWESRKGDAYYDRSSSHNVDCQESSKIFMGGSN